MTKKHKPNIFAQMRAYEQRKKKKLPNWVVIDENNEILEKFRLQNAAINFVHQNNKNYFKTLKIVRLDENGKPVVPYKR